MGFTLPKIQVGRFLRNVAGTVAGNIPGIGGVVQGSIDSYEQSRTGTPIYKQLGCKNIFDAQCLARKITENRGAAHANATALPGGVVAKNGNSVASATAHAGASTVGGVSPLILVGVGVAALAFMFMLSRR